MCNVYSAPVRTLQVDAQSFSLFVVQISALCSVLFVMCNVKCSMCNVHYCHCETCEKPPGGCSQLFTLCCAALHCSARHCFKSNTLNFFRLQILKEGITCRTFFGGTNLNYWFDHFKFLSKDSLYEIIKVQLSQEKVHKFGWISLWVENFFGLIFPQSHPIFIVWRTQQREKGK